jgi:hypothetical protein
VVQEHRELEQGMVVRCVRGGTRSSGTTAELQEAGVRSELAEITRVRVRNGRYDVRFLADGALEKNKPIVDVLAIARMTPQEGRAAGAIGDGTIDGGAASLAGTEIF